MQELTGAIIEHYSLQRHLARGGMSEIYLASDSQTQQTVAIKVVHRSNTDYCERFQREVKAISALSHDHILPAFAAGDYGDWCYLVMPYIEYGTLDNKLADGPLSLREAGIILEQLSSALQHAHTQGIIHRDIKPKNVLLRDGEHVYLTDFGLVKRVGEDNDLTATGSLIGTPDYMAPELAEGPASTSSDLYALGVVLYKMLTGHVPFSASTPLGILLKHIQERPQPPSTLNPALPEDVDEVVLRALEKEPGHRYKNVCELAQAYWRACERAQNARVAAAKQGKQEQALSPFALRRLAKPSPGVVFTWVAVFTFCLVPFVLGLVLPSNDDNTSVAQTVQTSTNTTLKKTSAGTTPTKTPTPAHPTNNSSTTAVAKTGPSPIPLAPLAFTQKKDQKKKDDKNPHVGQGSPQHKGPHHSGQGHGKF